MPEGHVVHLQARRLRRAFRGDKVRVDSPQGRFTDGAKRINKRSVTDVQAYGKHLFIDFDNDLSIHVHLGLYGKWRFGKGSVPDPVGLIRLRLHTPEAYAELRGPTACDVLDGVGVSAVLAKIGPDPIRRDADPDTAWARISRSNAPIATLLMDQKVISGVGNIYRAEVLFRHGIDPYRPGRDIDVNEFTAMWEDLVVLMTDGSKRGRIDTVRDEHSPEVMGRDARVDRHGGEVYVYRRAGRECYLCGTEVSIADLQGRHLFWCASCQRDR